MVRSALFAATIAGLSACAGSPGAPPEGQVCPFTVTSADAWINMMPSVGSRSRSLQVSVGLADAGDAASLQLSPESTPGTLVLELRPGSAPIPGQAAYREAAGDPPRERVSIRCGGTEVRAIGEIMRVY